MVVGKTRRTVKVTCSIPLSYKCSKCGKINAASIDIETTDMFTTTDSHLVRNELLAMEEHSFRVANDSAVRQVREYYKQPPLYWGERIKGKCTACGNEEQWLQDARESGDSDVMQSVGAVIIMLIGIGLAIALKKFVIALIALGVVVVAGSILGRVGKKKKAAKRAARMAASGENAPRYTLPEEAVIAGLNKKLEASIFGIYDDRLHTGRLGQPYDAAYVKSRISKNVVDYCEAHASDLKLLEAYMRQMTANYSINPLQAKILLEHYQARAGRK